MTSTPDFTNKEPFPYSPERAKDEKLKPKKPKHTHKWDFASYFKGYYKTVTFHADGIEEKDWQPEQGVYVCICGKRKLVEYKD